LHTLDLSGCEQLAALPVEFSRLTDLHTLSLNGCSTLSGLPVGVEELTGLRVLDLSFFPAATSFL
jgi:hypothetical protein